MKRFLVAAGALLAGISLAGVASADEFHSGKVTGWKAGGGCFVMEVKEGGAFTLYGIPQTNVGQATESAGALVAFSNHFPLDFNIGALPDLSCYIPGEQAPRTVAQAYRLSQDLSTVE